MNTTLIATLGAEPQVVSLTTQLLWQQAVRITRVVVLHTQADRPPVSRALFELRKHFAERPEWPQLQTVSAPIADVLTLTELETFTTALYTVIRTCVADRGRVHLLLAGGRKSMAMLGMSVAQLLLGPEDRVWYLHSDEALRLSGRMTLQDGDQAQLVPIPLAQRTPVPPVLTRSFQASTPGEALLQVEAEQIRRVSHFLQRVLTPTERQLAILIAEEVLTVKEIAGRLHKSPKTITNQLTAVYNKLEAEFGLEPDVGVKREFLRRLVKEQTEFGS